MADKKLDKLLAEAQKAYQKKEKRRGDKLVGEILAVDFLHPGAWQLLHQMYGGNRPFGEFQRFFTLQYYPDKLYLVSRPAQASQAAPQAVPAKKPSFWARLFGRGKKTATEQAPAAPPAGTPAGMPPAEPVTTPVKRVVIGTSLAERSSDFQPLSFPANKADYPGASAARRPDQAADSYPFLSTTSPLTGTGGLSGSPRPGQAAGAGLGEGKIRCVVVDDIAQTRETVIRSLRFQENIEVEGTAMNGVQAIELVKELKPEVVIMDVNMPDMDGITATSIIKREVPYAQVIILTVQDDVDYIRRAMNAGARDFLAKPPVIEELVAAVERAAEFSRREKAKMPQPDLMGPVRPVTDQNRGKIITVYSPRGGSGCTTLACNLAAMLYNEDTSVVIVDGNLQYGDVTVLFNIQNKTSILDLAPRVEEIDIDLVNEVLITHTSGVKILAPSRPERAELVTGPQFSQVLLFLSKHFNYIVVDTAHRLNDVTLAALDTSDLIMLVTTQDIPSISRVQKFLDLVPVLELDARRLLVVMNQFNQRILVDPLKVGQAFKHEIAAVLPVDSAAVITAVNQGTPFMLRKDIAARPIGKAFIGVTEAVRQSLAELQQPAAK
jgi:pilus assembly protein CpaE